MEGLTINPRQTLARQRIGKVSRAIQEAIDKICEDENYQVTYAEINAGIIEALHSNNQFELRELWKEKKSKKKTDE